MLDLIKDLLDSARLKSGRTVSQDSRVWVPEVAGQGTRFVIYLPGENASVADYAT